MNDPLNISLESVYSGDFPKTEQPPNKLLTPIKDHPHCYYIRIDNSTLEKWQTCPRAYQYYAVESRERPGSPALNFGTAAHIGWECYGKHGFGDVARADAIVKVTDHFTEHPQPEGDYRTLDYCLDMLAKYADHYEKVPYESVILGKAPLVEFPFSLHVGEVEVGKPLAFNHDQLLAPEHILPGQHDTPVYVDKLQFFWSGKIDQVVEFDGRRWVLDHKTTSMGGPTFYSDFMLAQQTIGYVWAAQTMFDFDIAGFILDAAICRRPTKTGKGLEFERQFYQYEQWHCDEWRRDISSQIGSCVDQLVDGYFPKKTKWCMGKYGACPYHDVCTMRPEQRYAMLYSSAFGNVTWSPLQ